MFNVNKHFCQHFLYWLPAFKSCTAGIASLFRIQHIYCMYFHCNDPRVLLVSVIVVQNVSCQMFYKVSLMNSVAVL